MKIAKYQYRHHHFLFNGGNERRMDEWLNQYGEDGWELVAVTNNPSVTEMQTYYFKRQNGVVEI